MDLSKIINQSKQREEKRLALLAAENDNLARTRIHTESAQNQILREVIAPCLESVFRQIIDEGIECSLTGGYNSQSKKTKRGLRIHWRGMSHCQSHDSIHVLCNVGGPPLDLFADSVYEGSVSQTEQAVFQSAKAALEWMPVGGGEDRGMD